MEISKELLSEVLGYEALPTQVSTRELQYIDKRRKHGAFHPCCINIYELSHRYKEWAKEQKYKIITENRDYGTEYIIINKNDTIFGEYEILHSDYAKTEQQAVFNACEQILKWSKNNLVENKGKKDV